MRCPYPACWFTGPPLVAFAKACSSSVFQRLSLSYHCKTSQSSRHCHSRVLVVFVYFVKVGKDRFQNLPKIGLVAHYYLCMVSYLFHSGEKVIRVIQKKREGIVAGHDGEFKNKKWKEKREQESPGQKILLRRRFNFTFCLWRLCIESLR